MAEETLAAAQPAGAEPAQQGDLDRATSDESIDSMLSSIPGFDKYFGASSDNKSGEPAKGKASASPGEPETAGTITDEVLAAGKEEKESSAETAEAGEKAELPEAVQQRIDRLTAARRDLEDSVSTLTKKNAELESKLSNAGARGPVSTPENPLGDIVTYEALERRFLDAQQAKLWALQNLDGGSVLLNTETGETRELNGQEVKALLAHSDDLLTRMIPKRKQYLDARVDFDRQANSYYTDYQKPDSELSRTLATWVQMFPEMMRFPDFRLIVADSLVGQKIRYGRLAAKNGSSGSKTPTLAAPSPSASARVPAKSVLSKDLLDRMASDRSALDIFSESLIGSGTRKK